LSATASNTVDGAPSIVEMARALKGTATGSTAVGQIFEFVYNNIEWMPGWGVQKGALGCLMDGMGSQFDQGLLLANLLREAGFTANIVMGTIRLTEAQYQDWWNVLDIWTARNYCFNLFVPVAVEPTWTGTEFYMDIRHVWVEVVISGTTYVLDSSYKTYSRKTGMSTSALASALGYSQSTFLSNAQSGATVTADYTENMNSDNIAADLTTFTSNLVSYIQTNSIGSAPAGTATIDDVLGGQEIVPVTLPLSLSTTLAYQAPGDTPTVWTGDVPSSFKPTLQVQFPNWTTPGVWDIDETFESDQLAATRLTLWYDGSLVPSLYLNGVSVATGLAQGAGTWTSIFLTVTHPAYDASNYPVAAQQYYQTTWQWWQQFIWAGSGFVIANSWGNAGRGQANYHAEQLTIAKTTVGSSHESQLTEALSLAWWKWSSQNSRQLDLANRLTNCVSMYCHQVAVLSGINDSELGIDIGGISGSSSNLDNDVTKTPINDTIAAMHGVALEAAVLAQVTGKLPATSTTTVIDVANRTTAVTLGGTFTPGDTTTIFVHDSALPGGVVSESAALGLPADLSDICTALALDINNNTDLNSLGVSAVAVGQVLYLTTKDVNHTTFTYSTSVGATVTVNIAQEKIFFGNSSNWSTGTNIQSTLLANGYNSSDMTDIDNIWITPGDTVMIPSHPNQNLAGWTGWGYWGFPSSGAAGIINGAFNGGTTSCSWTYDPLWGLLLSCSFTPSGDDGGGNPNPGQQPNNQEQSNEPIGLFTGDYFYETTDISIGSQEFPYGLTLKRFYNSANRNVINDSGLGRGWSHNLAMTAKVGNDGLLAMGDQFAIQGAATIAELFVSFDLLSDSSRPIDKVVTSSLADKWWIDQIVNNTVLLNNLDGTVIFVKQPDGTYTAPASFPATLSLISGAYTLTNPQGQAWHYDSSGKISSIVYPEGVTVSFTWSGNRLQSVSNGLGRTLTFVHSMLNNNLLLSVSDGTGRTISYDYDPFTVWDLIKVTDANGKDTTFAYDQPGRLTQIFLPAFPSTAVCTNVYDSLSRIQTQTNARSQQWTFYFANSRTEEVDPLGNSSVKYFNRLGSTTRSINALGQETTFLFDGLNRLVKTTRPEGNYTELGYDLNNNMLTKTFVAKPGSGLSNIVLNFTYDSTWNKVQTAQDGRGNTTTYNWHATNGTLTNIQRPIIGGFTPTVSHTYNARGQILTTTDETGIVTQNTYDSGTEKLLSTVVDFGTAPHLNLTTSFGHDTVGNTTSITDPNGNQTTFIYDNQRRLTQKTEAAPFAYLAQFGYDDSGNLTSLKKQISGMPAWQMYTYGYSATNKKTSETDPLGKVTTWTFDGADRLQTLTDEQLRQWQYAYDALNRLYTVTDPASIVADTRTYTTNGLSYQITDARSKTTIYSYDGFDRLNKRTFHDTTFEQNSSYDANGNVLTYVTRSGNTVTRTYDVLNRLSTKVPQGQATVTLTYDLAGRVTKMNKPTVSGDPSTGDFQFFFDTAGRFFQEQYPDSKQVTHVLDNNGNRTRTTWPDGYYVTQVFDQLNRLTDIKLNGSGTSAAILAYDELSRRTTLTFSNGCSHSYSYALNDNLTTLTQNFVGSGKTNSFGYNNVHQLVSDGATDATFVWHPSGSSSTAYGTADSVNNYPTVGGVGYSYDGNKNLSGDGTWTFGYDTENHLLTASKSGTSASFVYDPKDRQAQKTVGSVKTRYIYSGWRRIADYDGTSGSLQNRYVYGTSLDEPLITVSSGGTLTFLHHDRLGSIIATTNSTGVVTNKNLFSAYGEIASLSGTSFGFTGQRYDSETGLYYYKLRYYSPSLGRFLQPDPIGYQDGLNLYSYVNNNTLSETDPMGLATWGNDPKAKPYLWGSDPQFQWGTPESALLSTAIENATSQPGTQGFLIQELGTDPIYDPITGKIYWRDALTGNIHSLIPSHEPGNWVHQWVDQAGNMHTIDGNGIHWIRGQEPFHIPPSTEPAIPPPTIAPHNFPPTLLPPTQIPGIA